MLATDLGKKLRGLTTVWYNLSIGLTPPLHYIQSHVSNKGYETLPQQYNAPVAGLHAIYHAKVVP